MFFVLDILTLLALVVCKVTCDDVNSPYLQDEYTDEGHFIRIYASLTEVPLDIPSGAKRVSLNDNRITVIGKNEFHKLFECTGLILYDNRINQIETGAFSGLGNLHVLNLNNNDLKQIRSDVWVGLSSLKWLSLDLNELEDLPAGAFVGLNKLEELTLAYNDLQQIRDRTFQGLPALKRLFLHNSDITFLEPGAFTNLLHLKWLDLESNDLETLEMRAFLDPSHPYKHPTDLYLEVESNPLLCDERLCWLKEAERKNWIELDYISPSPGKCANYPKDTYWIDINLNCAQAI